ncbi:MAG: glycosyltransferase family 4 protein [Candidatus Omnitrophota bacterium]|nr:glycosyltransferase family 4 protein [Candidatus Omnitrophota bacterium]
MNILILTTHFNEGGITRYCLGLGKKLKAKGHNVYVASSGGNLIEALKKNGIEHIELKVRTKSELSPKIWCALFPLKKILREKNIQLIHAQTRVTQVLAFFCGKFYQVPYVTTCHGFFNTRFSRRIFPCWGKKVIAISSAVEKHLIDDFKVDGAEVKYIANGLDVNQFKIYDEKAKQDFKNKLNLSSGPIIGIIARLSSVKGHRYLIEAMPQALKEFPSAQLLIVGDGSLKDELLKLCRDLGISKNVIFHPGVDDTSLALSVMDIFVMPSLQEGLGLSIMEAMAAGVPVIASRVGGIPDLIKDNQTGILVSAQDSFCLAKAIIRLLKDKNLQLVLSKNALKLIEQDFSLDKMADLTEELYKSVVSKNVP